MYLTVPVHFRSECDPSSIHAISRLVQTDTNRARTRNRLLERLNEEKCSLSIPSPLRNTCIVRSRSEVFRAKQATHASALVGGYHTACACFPSGMNAFRNDHVLHRKTRTIKKRKESEYLSHLDRISVISFLSRLSIRQPSRWPSAYLRPFGPRLLVFVHSGLNG